MAIYEGVNGVNREISSIYRGISGVNREILNSVRAVNGVNREVFSAGTKLYDNGASYTQFEPVSSFSNVITSTVNPMFDATSLRLNVDSVSTGCGVITTNKINLTEFKKIQIDCTANFNLSGGDNLSVVITSAKTNVHTAYIKQFGLAVVNDQRKIHVLDISDVGGEFYIAFYVVNGPTLVNRQVTCYKINLKK